MLGSTLLAARTLTSLCYCGDWLSINALGKFYILQGSSLHHCVIDLVCGECERIEVVVPSPIELLQWQVHGISPESRLPVPKEATAPFHAIVPKGWLLFETLAAWHFWPIEDLLAIALTRSRLLFIYESATIEVKATPTALRNEFDRWVTRTVTARHYTERDVDAFMKLPAMGRFHAWEVRCRFCDPVTGLKGQDIKGWLSLSGKLPTPPRRKTLEIER